MPHLGDVPVLPHACATARPPAPPRAPQRPMRSAVCLAMALAGWDAVTIARATPPEGLTSPPDHLTHLLIVLLGMAAVWALAGLARPSQRPNGWLMKLAPLSFFVFAAHEPLLEGLKKLGAKFLTPSTPVEAVLAYLAPPMLAVAITLGVAIAWRSLWPSGYAFVTGRRPS